MKKNKQEKNKRKICTKETPCDGKGRWAHPDAVLKYDDVDVLWYECPICGTYFGETQPN